MMISFYGLETVLECKPGTVLTFEVADQVLFANICQSLVSGMRDQAIEPYMLWDNGGEPLRASDEPIVIVDPFTLPWGERSLVGALYARIGSLSHEDDSVRSALGNLEEALSTSILGLSLQLEANYEFGIEWDMSRYLKAFGFGPEHSAEDRLIDNIENYLSVMTDAGVKKTLVFINLKNFLCKQELERLTERVKILGCSVLLLEFAGKCDKVNNEVICGVDQQFIEY